MDHQANPVFGDPRNSAPASASLNRAARRSAAKKGYALGVGILACLLSCTLWWLLRNEKGEPDNSALTAAMSAVLVILVGFLGRDRVLRRSAARRRPHQRYDTETAFTRVNRRRTPGAVSQRTAALNALERKLADASAKANVPEQHLQVYRICEEYIAGLNDSLGGAGLAPHARQGLRARQDRVLALQKRHLLSWARESSQKLIHQAQHRARVSAKIELALQATTVIESALRVYPNERQLQDSVSAIREYMSFTYAEHWSELAERAAFKGHHRKAIDRYENALFYLNRDKAWSPSRAEVEERIQRRMQSLQANLVQDDEAGRRAPSE